MLAAVLMFAAVLPGPRPDDGEALLRRINAAHKATWFTTLTFVQRSSWPGTSRPDETWYETMDRPGKLRLDMFRRDSLYATVLFRHDTLYQRAGGTVSPGRPLVHSLLVLLHDIHVGDIDAAIAKLRGEGFDLSTTHAATWQGAPVTVVGAAADDSTTKQFWVDTDRMVVVRVLQPGPKDGHSETQVGGFVRQGDALVESDIRFLVDGRLEMHEEYRDIKTGMALPASTFDPANPDLPAWVVQARGN